MIPTSQILPCDSQDLGRHRLARTWGKMRCASQIITMWMNIRARQAGTHNTSLDTPCR